MKALHRTATVPSWGQLDIQVNSLGWDSCSLTSFPGSWDGFKSFTMSEMLLKDMDEVNLDSVKKDEEKEKENGRSFLLVDENESLQVCFC